MIPQAVFYVQETKFPAHKTLQEIALGWQRRCCYRNPPQAKNLASEILSYSTSSLKSPLVNRGICSIGVFVSTVRPPSNTSFVHTFVHLTPDGK